MNRELAEVGADPLAPELLGDRRCSATASEEIGDEVAFVSAGFDDSFEQSFGFLGRIAESFFSIYPAQHLNIVPNIL